MLRTWSFAFPLIVFAAGCARDKPPSEATIENTTFAPSLGIDLAGMAKTPTGLYYKDVIIGTGPEAVPGQQVSVHYAGALADGTQFDANGSADPAYSFKLGVGAVIAGWDEGVAGMKVGGRRQLIIPSSLGYGIAGHGPIPGHSILVFTVDLVGLQ
ncbi:MAG: FKBP-type peptidyl-prolyl cis-trans isomerase [Gemmatimonadota bacterium]